MESLEERRLADIRKANQNLIVDEAKPLYYFDVKPGSEVTSICETGGFAPQQKSRSNNSYAMSSSGSELTTMRNQGDQVVPMTPVFFGSPTSETKSVPLANAQGSVNSSMSSSNPHGSSVVVLNENTIFIPNSGTHKSANQAAQIHKTDNPAMRQVRPKGEKSNSNQFEV